MIASRVLRLMLLSSTAVALSTLGPAWAADAPASAKGDKGDKGANQTEEILVTARRRAEVLQAVPVTLTAISGGDLKDFGISNIRDIVGLVPNAVIQDSPNNLNTFINIRGMQLVNTQAEPNVGLYRNGLYAGGQRENLAAQVDVERVEILRGPQGGYYGRSSVGGTVDIIAAMPKPEWGGYLKGSYGSYHLAQIEGALNVPVTDRVATRFAGWDFVQTQAEMKNATLNQYVGAFKDRGVRGSADLQLTDKLDIQLLAEYQAYSGPALTSFAANGVTGNGLSFQPTPKETYKTVYRDTSSTSAKTNAYFFEKTSYQSSIGQFDLNASYREYSFSSQYDLDQTPLGPPFNIKGVTGEHDSVHDTFVEGLYSSDPDAKFTWMIGGSFFKEDYKYNVEAGYTLNIDAVTGLPLGLGVQTVPVGSPQPGTTTNTESRSVFATAGYAFDNHWSLSGGLRYNSDRKKLIFKSGIEPISNPLLAAVAKAAFGSIFPTYNLSINKTFDFTAPSVTLKYAFDDTLNVYVSYGTGFRPGAFNLTPTSAATVPYDEETAENFEVGVKSTLLGGRLALDAAVFYMPQDNVLITQTAALGQSYYANVGTSKTLGFEVEALVKANDWLSGGLSLGLLDPKFDRAVVNAGTANAFSLNNRLLPYTRRGTINALVKIDKPVTDSVHFIASGALRSEWGGRIGDYVGIDKPYNAFNKIDLQAGALINDKLRITGNVRNLLDQHVAQFWFYNQAQTVTQGRTYSIDVSYRF